MGGFVGSDLCDPSILLNLKYDIIIKSKVLIPVMEPKLSTVVRTKVMPNESSKI